MFFFNTKLLIKAANNKSINTVGEISYVITKMFEIIIITSHSFRFLSV